MKTSFKYFSIISIFALAGCSSKTPTSNTPELIYIRDQTKVPQQSNFITKIFKRQNSNLEGANVINMFTWTVPDNVYSVKVIGCSGGNGGGGGGAGGGGGPYYNGNWAGNALGGNGSAGGAANVNSAGENGQPGKIGHYCNGNEENPCYPAQRAYPGQSAGSKGADGEEGEISHFGAFIFPRASENTKNTYNTTLISHLVGDDYSYCQGGTGGRGGAGGLGTIIGRENEPSLKEKYGSHGGRGGNGADGRHAFLTERELDVQPGQVIEIYVGKGGNGGNGSTAPGGESLGGTHHNPVQSLYGRAGQSGASGNAGSDGIVILKYVELK